VVNKSVVITFDDPQTYEGPVVRGWEPYKNRNTSLYLKPQESTLLMDPLGCREVQERDIEMIVIQHSRPGNFTERLANRVSWMKFAKR